MARSGPELGDSPRSLRQTGSCPSRNLSSPGRPSTLHGCNTSAQATLAEKHRILPTNEASPSAVPEAVNRDTSGGGGLERRMPRHTAQPLKSVLKKSTARQTFSFTSHSHPNSSKMAKPSNVGEEEDGKVMERTELQQARQAAEASKSATSGPETKSQPGPETGTSSDSMTLELDTDGRLDLQALLRTYSTQANDNAANVSATLTETEDNRVAPMADPLSGHLPREARPPTPYHPHFQLLIWRTPISSATTAIGSPPGPYERLAFPISQAYARSFCESHATPLPTHLVSGDQFSEEYRVLADNQLADIVAQVLEYHKQGYGRWVIEGISRRITNTICMPSSIRASVKCIEAIVILSCAGKTKYGRVGKLPGEGLSTDEEEVAQEEAIVRDGYDKNENRREPEGDIQAVPIPSSVNTQRGSGGPDTRSTLSQNEYKGKGKQTAFAQTPAKEDAILIDDDSVSDESLYGGGAANLQYNKQNAGRTPSAVHCSKRQFSIGTSHSHSFSEASPTSERSGGSGSYGSMGGTDPARPGLIGPVHLSSPFPELPCPVFSNSASNTAINEQGRPIPIATCDASSRGSDRTLDEAVAGLEPRTPGYSPKKPSPVMPMSDWNEEGGTGPQTANDGDNEVDDGKKDEDNRKEEASHHVVAVTPSRSTVRIVPKTPSTDSPAHSSPPRPQLSPRRLFKDGKPTTEVYRNVGSMSVSEKPDPRYFGTPHRPTTIASGVTRTPKEVVFSALVEQPWARKERERKEREIREKEARKAAVAASTAMNKQYEDGVRSPTRRERSRPPSAYDRSPARLARERSRPAVGGGAAESGSTQSRSARSRSRPPLGLGREKPELPAYMTATASALSRIRAAQAVVPPKQGTTTQPGKESLKPAKPTTSLSSNVSSRTTSNDSGDIRRGRERDTETGLPSYMQPTRARARSRVDRTEAEGQYGNHPRYMQPTRAKSRVGIRAPISGSDDSASRPRGNQSSPPAGQEQQRTVTLQIRERGTVTMHTQASLERARQIAEHRERAREEHSRSPVRSPMRSPKRG